MIPTLHIIWIYLLKNYSF